MRRHQMIDHIVAMLLSFVLPGLGQFRQERTMRGAFFMGLWLLGWLIPLRVVYHAQAWVWVLLFGLVGHTAAAVDAAVAGCGTGSSPSNQNGVLHS